MYFLSNGFVSFHEQDPRDLATCGGNIQGVRVWNVANHKKVVVASRVRPGGTTTFCESMFVNLEALTDTCVKDVDFYMTGPNGYLRDHHEGLRPFVLFGDINDRELDGRYLKTGTYTLFTTPDANHSKEKVFKIAVKHC